MANSPLLLFVCHPLTGHFTPVSKIAAALKARGWAVSFLSSAFFRARIEAAGLEFFPLCGTAADLNDETLFDRGQNRPPVSSGGSGAGPVPLIIDMRHQTIEALPDAWESVKSALVTLHARDPTRQVIIVCEAFFYGILPLKYGAPLPDGIPPPRTLCVSITAPAIRSRDLPPFGSPFPFDPSPSGRQRNAALWEEFTAAAKPVTELLERKLREAGATRGFDGEVFLGGVNYTCHPAILQVGLPEFEYPRSDFPPGFRIIGIIPPPQQVSGRTDLDWWAELVANGSPGAVGPNASRKKVVVVAQGTVETDPTELTLPTLRLLAERADVLTVAILGSRGAKLPADARVPHNARVADYLQYDAVLPFADLWIHNGGYGATMHGIAHGVPMVIAGEGQDKPESGKRVAWSGLGVDLACARPPEEQLGRAIDEVLTNPAYRRVARMMRETAGRMDCFGIMEEEVRKVVEALPN